MRTCGQLHRRLLVTVAAICCTMACGGDGPEQGQDQGPIPIRSGARLGWDQAAGSRDEARALTFRLYVDDAQSALSDVQCGDAQTGGRFQCSGRLPSMTPGRHRLELTAIQNGAESARSPSITVDLASTTQIASPQSSGDDRTQHNPDFACMNTPSNECFQSIIVASGLEPVTALSAAPDGRIFFVEGGRSVRVISDGRVLPDAALELEAHVRATGLALDVNFISTSTVFVSWTDSAAREPLLNITRYREVQNTFGEGATIVSNLPFREGAQAPLAVDAEGRLYVAVPAAEGLGTGVVARFTGDGFVPGDNPAGQPAIAEGVVTPRGLAIDPLDGRVWLAGNSPEARELVVSFNPAASGRRASRPIPAQEASGQHALAGLLVGAPSRLLRTSQGLNATPLFTEEVRFSSGFEVLAVTESINGDIYVAIGDQNGRSSILRLSR